ncbi:acyltransferase family protein [Prevotella dentasini]
MIIRMNTADMQSQVISALRYPLVVLVLLIHSDFKGISQAWDGALLACPSLSLGDAELSVRTFIGFVSGTLAPLANPFFFFLSGLLFFREGEFSRALYLRKLRSRVRSLLVPYLLWNALFLLVLCLGETLRPGWTSAVSRPVADFGLADWLLAFWDISLIGGQGGIAAPLDIPLWFVRDLMAVSVLSPLVYVAVRWLSSFRREIAPVVLMALLYALRWAPELPGISFQGLLFFAFGAYFGINRLSIAVLFRPALWVGVLLSFYFCQKNLPNLMYASLIIGIVSFATRRIERRRAKGQLPSPVFQTLTEASFFIFAGHTLPLGAVVYLLKAGWLSPSGSFGVLAVYLLCPVLLTLLIVLPYLLLRRFLPVVAGWLTGGRG